jgi:hypothetical protein
MFESPVREDVGQLPHQENGKLYERLLKDRHWAHHTTRILNSEVAGDSHQV